VKRAPTYDWDEVKRARNIAEHKVDFSELEKFEMGIGSYNR
jgi:uncharacterized DUF497 family protein